MTIDTSSAEARLQELEAFALGGWIPPAAEAVRLAIIEETGQGRDANSVMFENWGPNQVYSPRQEKRRQQDGRQVGMKDLGSLPGSLQLRTLGGVPSLSVAESPSDKLNRIAHGQMYHPKWRYHHNFLAVGHRAIEAMMAALKAAF